MFDPNWRNPVVPDASKPLPVEPLAFLTTSTQGVLPSLTDFTPKGMHGIHIAQLGKVVLVSDHY